MAKAKKTETLAPVQTGLSVTTAEESRFYQLAAIVDKGMESFIEVGKALMELRDGKSYKAAGYETFEDLCQRGFGICRDMAYRTINASALTVKMSTIVDIPNEGTARELLKIKDEAVQLAVAKRAKEMVVEQHGECLAISSANVKAAKAELIPTAAKAKPIKAEVVTPNLPTETDQIIAVRTLSAVDPLIQKIAAEDGLSTATATPTQLLAILFRAYATRSSS